MADTSGATLEEYSVDATTGAFVQEVQDGSPAEAADLRLFLRSGAEALPVAARAGDIEAIGKADLVDARDCGVLYISGVTGEGLGELVSRIGEALGDRVAGAGIMVRERHRVAILRAAEALRRVLADVAWGAERVEIAADELRSAVQALDSLIGRVDVEDLLDEIFASFCIGK